MLTRAAGQGCTVLRGAARELVTAFPLRLMADCLGVSAGSADPAHAEIAGLLRGTGEHSGSVDPVLAASERMIELIDRRCADGPVVLAVEDLQWADEPSLLLWHRLARAVDQIPLLLVGTARAVPRRPQLARLRDLADLQGGVLLDLGPLAPAAVAELAARTVGETPGPGLIGVLTRAGGNPLYVSELAAGLHRDGLVAVSGGVAELDGALGTVPASLRAAIENRLRSLTGETRDALRVAAVMGNEFDAAEWATATGRSVIEVAAMAEAAAADGVVSGVGDRLSFRHELIQQVLADQIPGPDRPVMHTQIARNLAGAGHGVDAVARHLLAVPGAMEDWTLDWLAGLGEAALYALPQVSAELLDRAVASAGRADPRWEPLAARLARVLFWIGRDDRASQFAGQVAAVTSDPVRAARMRIQMIRSAGRTGRPWQGRLVLAGRPADRELPLPWRARLAAWLALLLHADGEIIQGEAMAGDALGTARQSGDPLAIATAEHAAAMCGGLAARPQHLQAALAALRGQDPESTELRMILLANHIAVTADRALREHTEEALGQGLRLAERSGATSRAADILAAAADVSYQYGRWDDALAHLAAIDQETLAPAALRACRGLAALIALRRGDRPAADDGLGLFADDPGGEPVYPLTEGLAARAQADDDLALAVSLMSGWLAVPAGLRVHERHDRSLPYLTRLALAAGQTGTARTAAAVSEADAAISPSPSRAAAARCCQAMIGDDAAGLLAVASSYESYGWPPMHAFALEEAAVRLAAAGDAAAARTALTGAVRIYDRLGATADIRRADGRLRGHGVRRGPHSIRRGPTSGWDSLTPAEQRVAHLVGQGLSNPDIAAELFLSRRTVQTHVSRILGKLGLSSRLEIVRALAQRDRAG
jgi:DNA-binding CsgD family transcriptional regulator